MGGQHHDAVVDGFDGGQLVCIAAVAKYVEVAQRGGETVVVAPVGEGLEELAELVEVGSRLHARQLPLLVEQAEEIAALQRLVEDLSHILARAHVVQCLDVTDAAHSPGAVGFVEC